MANQGFIYKITSPSGKIYIGQTIDLKRRIAKYKNLHCKAQPKIYNSIIKYGFENHCFEIIEQSKIDELNERERYYQELYNCINKGLNCIYTKTDLKKGITSNETKLKQSKAKIGKMLSDNTKAKMKQSHKKRDCSHSEDSKKKISKSKQNISINTRLKLSEKQWKRKIILDYNTGVYYNSAVELALLYNIKRTTIQSRLSGQNINNTSFKYV